MENWEFFLQKVGTENWLSVDTAQPEFPNGRYTIAARAAHRPKEWIEVDIRTRHYLPTGEKVRKGQQTCQLDETGWARIVPDIELTPGVWEIQCRGDVLSALMGEDWEITLSLRVTLRLENAATHFPSSTVSALTTSDQLAAASPEEDFNQLRSRLLDDADQMFQEIVADLFPTFTSGTETFDWQPSATPYTLHLDEDILVAQTSKPIILSGEITTQEEPPHPQLCLQISLRDPRTGETVAKLSPRLRNEPFPLTFCYSVSVPIPCESYLLEGEVVLCEAAFPGESTVFARHPFTVSANWEKLEPLVVGAIGTATVAHPPAPLSPLTFRENQFSRATASRGDRIFPPKLSTKAQKKKKTPPTLPQLPHHPSSSPVPVKEYVWSKPGEATDASATTEWELISELVIIASDETES